MSTSKTSGANWAAARATAFWKQCAASGIAFARSYRADLFLRTEVNIIALQVAYAALIGALAISALLVLYRNIVSGVVSAIEMALTSTTTPISGNAIALSFEAARTREIAVVALLICLATALFGYLIARLALAPARAALKAQKQFIGNIAHELRTPLSIIKANTEVRLFRSDLPSEARAIHESNLEELDRISGIINNLLTLNTLVRPEQVPFAPIALGVLARRVVEQLATFAQEKSVRVTVAIPATLAAWGNSSAIEQVLMNLVKNAIGYTKHGSVDIGATLESAGGVELTVRDTGSGIKAEDLSHIFEPFYRGDRARTRTGGTGAGLGLTIVSELVKLHQGRVTIQSAPGKGTTVRVLLPPAPTHAKESAAPPEYNEISADFSSSIGPGGVR